MSMLVRCLIDLRWCPFRFCARSALEVIWALLVTKLSNWLFSIRQRVLFPMKALEITTGQSPDNFDHVPRQSKPSQYRSHLSFQCRLARLSSLTQLRLRPYLWSSVSITRPYSYKCSLWARLRACCKQASIWGLCSERTAPFLISTIGLHLSGPTAMFWTQIPCWSELDCCRSIFADWPDLLTNMLFGACPSPLHD